MNNKYKYLKIGDNAFERYVKTEELRVANKALAEMKNVNEQDVRIFFRVLVSTSRSSSQLN